MSQVLSQSSTPEGGDAVQYWDQWNREWRFRDRLDPFMQRQLDVARSIARDAGLEDARILGIGSGTGWLEHGLLRYGQAWATDLSPEAVAEGRRRHPGLHLVCGDFMRLDLPSPFDLVISADSLVPMADYEECVRRVAALLKPDGIFLLMTQNPMVWRRRSKLRLTWTSVPHAAVTDWPTLRQIRSLLRRDFSIERVTTICPGGDSGLLWWVENKIVERSFAHFFGHYRWSRILEVLGLGRELVIVARRRAPSG